MNETNWAKFIWNEALQKTTLPFKWGFDYRSVREIEKGTEFKVGLMIPATIRIQHEDWRNTFQVSIIPDSAKEPIVIDGVMLDKVVFTINESLLYFKLYQQSSFEDYRLAS